MNANDSTGDSIHTDPTQPASPAAASSQHLETPDWDATDPAHPVRKLNSAYLRDDIIARTKFTLPPLPSSTPYPPPSALVEPSSSKRPLPEDISIQSPGSPVIGRSDNQQRAPGQPGSTSIVSPSSASAIKFMFPSAPGTTTVSGPLSLHDRSLPKAPVSIPHKQSKSNMRKPLIFALIALAAVLLLTILFTIASTLVVSPENGPSALPILRSNVPEITSKSPINHPGAPGTGAPGVRSFQTGPHPLVVIKGYKGDMNISTGSNGTVLVNARKHGSSSAGSANMQVQYAQSKDERGQDRLDITTPPGNANIDFDVMVPAAAQVQIQMDGGAITVNGISGVTIDTFSGNLDVENINGLVDVQTENGDITARSLNGQVKIQTQNGSIRMNTINGQVQALTQNGDVIVRKAALKGQSILVTNNGSVRVDGSLAPNGSYKLKTIRGDINLSLPANAAFQLSAHTASGSVSNDFGASIVGAAPRSLVNLTIGGGGSISVNQTI
jgi:hypothetical protein